MTDEEYMAAYQDGFKDAQLEEEVVRRGGGVLVYRVGDGHFRSSWDGSTETLEQLIAVLDDVQDDIIQHLEGEEDGDEDCDD